MAYTAPTTRATADLITAAIWNTDLVENIKFLANPPACRVYHSANQSLTNAVALPLAFNSERYDTDSMHSTATNNGRITINTAGLYVITASASFAPNATGDRALDILVGGSTAIASNLVRAAGSFDTRLVVSTVYKLAAGDYLTVNAFQNSGAAVNISAAGNYSPEFSAKWVGLG